MDSKKKKWSKQESISRHKKQASKQGNSYQALGLMVVLVQQLTDAGAVHDAFIKIEKEINGTRIRFSDNNELAYLEENEIFYEAIFGTPKTQLAKAIKSTVRQIESLGFVNELFDESSYEYGIFLYAPKDSIGGMLPYNDYGIDFRKSKKSKK